MRPNLFRISTAAVDKDFNGVWQRGAIKATIMAMVLYIMAVVGMVMAHILSRLRSQILETSFTNNQI